MSDYIYADASQDLKQYREMFRDAPDDYPGKPLMRRRLSELEALVAKNNIEALLEVLDRIESRNPGIPQTLDVDEIRGILGIGED